MFLTQHQSVESPVNGTASEPYSSRKNPKPFATLFPAGALLIGLALTAPAVLADGDVTNAELLETIKAMVASGASALAVEAGRTLFVQRDEALPLIRRHRIAFWGCRSSDFRESPVPAVE